MILEQFENIRLSRFEIVLQARGEAILPALIGSSLRGAFGHALKAISCSVRHQDCEKCFLSEVCLYPTIFEPTSNSKIKDLPRAFVFEPPIPPFTRQISENQTLKLRVAENGKISFGLTLIGEVTKKLPYFIYAFDLMSQHGLGENRHQFSVSEVFQIGLNAEKSSIYTPGLAKILSFSENNLRDFVEARSIEFGQTKNLKITFQTPLRIRRNRELLEKLNFSEFFKQCSLRLKFLSENYGQRLDYDYQSLMKLAETVECISDKFWKHRVNRRSNRQHKSIEIDGILGEIMFQTADFGSFLPFLLAGELLNIGSASSLGLGKYSIEKV